MIGRLIHSIILSTLACLLFAISAEAANVKVALGFCGINYSDSTNKITITPGALGMIAIEPKSPWDVKRVSPTVFLLRTPNEKGAYLKIDTERKQIFAVTGGTFEKGDGSEKPVNNAAFAPPPLPFMPQTNSDLALMIRLNDAFLAFDSDGNDAAVIFEGTQLLGPEDFELIRPEEGIYHLRLKAYRKPKSASESYWKIDTRRKSLSMVIGHFGERGGREISLTARVTVENNNASTAEPEVHEDLGMAGVNRNEIRESSWISAEQGLFRELLEKQHFDVLVVPFQVQNNALDQIERSLMTRHLIRQIRMTTNLRVADPDIVERALGRGFRTYPEQSVYNLANALGVKKLIRGYAGHARDMKMRLTFKVQELAQGSRFDTSTRSTHAIFKDISFSDESLPSEVFAAMLPKLVPALGIKGEHEASRGESSDLTAAKLPITPSELLQSQDRSPVVLAAHLSLLGALSPPGTRTSQAFFERSLALLRNEHPESPDALFLKAYALSNLYRRPAAVELLNTTSTSEQVALRSALDGDLMALPEQVSKIRNPLPKLLMQIKLNDLRWAYDNQTARSQAPMASQEMPSAWNLFYTRRYAYPDHWDAPNSEELKQFMDYLYPIKGYSLKEIYQGMLVQGDVNSRNTLKIDVSIHEHRKRLLKDQPELISNDSLGFVRPLDLLDLAAAWAEDSIRKRVYIIVINQGLYEEGLSVLDRYEASFRGHPELTALKSGALRILAKQKGSEEGGNLRKMANDVDFNACYWFQGQSQTANSVCHGAMYYENDFPRREFWRRHKDSSIYGDRSDYEMKEIVLNRQTGTIDYFWNVYKTELRDVELALRYASYDFGTLETYYNTLTAHGNIAEAEKLIGRNKHRFNGNSRKATFLAGIYGKKDDAAAITRLYEDTIRVVPRNWQPYYELGVHYLYRGDARRAAESFRRFPPFKDGPKIGEEDNVDTVALSNNAQKAGATLLWAGAVQEAKPYYELSAGYQTGSSGEMWSEYMLALYDEDYQRAAQTLLALGRRYNSDEAYGIYLRFLSATGHGKESESLFFSLGLMNRSFIDWAPIITKLRIAGSSDEAVRTWLAENTKGKLNRHQAQFYYLRALLVDRRPDSGLADMMENIDRQVPLGEQQRPSAKRADQQGQVIPPLGELFARVHYDVIRKQHAKVAGLLINLERWYKIPTVFMQPILPYFAWSGTKTGKSADVDKLLAVHREKNGSDFEYWLAIAMKQAAEKKHDAALSSLDLARSNTNVSTFNMRPVSTWYQLVEACELLFDDTQVAAYRDKALEIVRFYQRFRPLDSWAYAVEAKYAKTKEERLQPLAKTLYLDRDSYRIAEISEQEKIKALEWLEKHNPFLETGKKEKNEAKAGSVITVPHPA